MSAKLPHKPEDWPRVFQQHLDAGDLDAVMALYDPQAHFVTGSGETLAGAEAIRKVVGRLIKARTQMQSRVIRAITAGDIAQLYTDFEATTIDSSGKTIQVRQKAIEVLRRQADGGWKLIIGDPHGRDSLRVGPVQSWLSLAKTLGWVAAVLFIVLYTLAAVALGAALLFCTFSR